MSGLIFSTVHGSHLYGLAHSGSDRDTYEVYEGKGEKLYQKTDGKNDVVQGTLEAFVKRAMTGSHQSVEALFSERKVWSFGMYERYGAYVEGFRVTGGEVFEKYERTIKKFCFGDFKRRRHAGRLSLNLRSLRERGRFNPELTPVEAFLVGKYAEALEGGKLLEKLIPNRG